MEELPVCLLEHVLTSGGGVDAATVAAHRRSAMLGTCSRRLRDAASAALSAPPPPAVLLARSRPDLTEEWARQNAEITSVWRRWEGGSSFKRVCGHVDAATALEGCKEATVTHVFRVPGGADESDVEAAVQKLHAFRREWDERVETVAPAAQLFHVLELGERAFPILCDAAGAQCEGREETLKALLCVACPSGSSASTLDGALGEGVSIHGAECNLLEHYIHELCDCIEGDACQCIRLISCVRRETYWPTIRVLLSHGARVDLQKHIGIPIARLLEAGIYPSDDDEEGANDEDYFGIHKTIKEGIEEVLEALLVAYRLRTTLTTWIRNSRT
mmetsp:Transcript_27499/g.89988  ORF Transcript_27499/g.89988 Transcript_27499/m.89988 type:complete len:331 (-) Transcript_27499:460-1452(-)